MTSWRQIEANRRNAQRSTGPVTEEGKRRSRQNAVRPGLCAETVVESVEDREDYRGFEAAVIADYDARTAVERELVLKLASLLWRLRRATAIETDLLLIQAEILSERRASRRSPQAPADYGCPKDSLQPRLELRENALDAEDSRQACSGGIGWRPIPIASTRQLTLSFQRLANLDSTVFERLSGTRPPSPAKL